MSNLDPLKFSPKTPSTPPIQESKLKKSEAENVLKAKSFQSDHLFDSPLKSIASDPGVFGVENANAQLAFRLDRVENVVNEFSTSPIPPSSSLDQILKKFENEELNLLFHQFQVIKKSTDVIWKSIGTIDSASQLATTSAIPITVAGALKPELMPISTKITTDIYKITLAYEIPSQLGHIGIMIYKKKFLDHLDDLIKSSPSGASPEQVKEFKEWIKSEKSQVAEDCKKHLVKFGASLPFKVLSAIKAFGLNVPIMQLAFTWLGSLIMPVLSAAQIKKGSAEMKVLDAKTEEFNKTMFKHASDEVQKAINKRKEALLSQRVLYEEDFNHLIQTMASKKSLSEMSQAMDKEGLNLPPHIKSPESFQKELTNVSFRQNLLARYIDVRSKQPLKDTTRNGLKALSAKKQVLQKKVLTSNVGKSKLMLAVSAVALVATVVLTILPITTPIVLPMIAMFLPTIGLLSFSYATMGLGLLKFRKEQPNLFREFSLSSQAKLISYELPKTLLELKQQAEAVKLLNASMMSRQIRANSIGKNSMDSKVEEEGKLKELDNIEKELRNRMEQQNRRIKVLENKINAIKQSRTEAKWMDFLQDFPKLGTESNRKEINQMLAKLKEGILSGGRLIDDEMKILLKEQFGLELSQLREKGILQEALKNFAI